MSSGNLLAWLRRAFDLAASGLWAVLARLLDALRDLGGGWAGLAALIFAVLLFFAARRMQARLVRLLVADPRRTVRWRDLELWFSLVGLLWLPAHLIRAAIVKLRAWLHRPKKRASEGPDAAPAGSAPPGETPADAAEKAKAAAEPLLVATLGPSFLLGGVATVLLYAVARLSEPLLGAQLGLAPGTPAWQYLLLGGRPELGTYLPLQDAPFLAGLLAVLFWLLVGWWSARFVRLVFRRPLGSNRYADREDDTVLPLWRRWAGATFLAWPAESYRAWASWLVAAAFPLLAWAWFSLASRPFRVEASEFAVAFVLWFSWATHLSLRGLERLPDQERSTPATEARAAGWPEVLDWLQERLQVASPRELDMPRPVERLLLTDIPAETDAVLSPLVLDLVPPPGGGGRLTAMQRVMLTDLSLLAYVHLDPPIDRDRLELTAAAGEVLEDRSGLRERHQVVIAPESAGKTALALLAAANHVLVHTRGALVVARDEAAEAALYQQFRETIEPTTLRWNVRIRRAGADLMNDLSRGIVPDVVVASLQRLTVDLLGNEGAFVRFLENLGLIVVDDVESFSGPVEDHAQLALRRLGARVCRLLGARGLDQKGAPQFLVLGTDSMDDLPAWARALCGIDAVARDFTRSRAATEEREAAEGAARGIPVRKAAGGAAEDLHDYLARVRQGRHQVFHRLRDFRTAAGEPLTASTLVEVCEQLAVPWHYRLCGDGRRRLGRSPLLLRNEPRYCVEAPEDACVIFLAGAWSDVRRERRRLRRAGDRFSRRRIAGSGPVASDEPEPIAFITLVDPDEEMAFTQLDERFGLKEVLDRLPYPILRSPSGRIRQAHLAADLVQHWCEVGEVLDVYGAGTAQTLTRLSRAGVLLTDPRVDVAADAPRYENRLQIRALARATPALDAPPVEVAAAPLPAQVTEVEVAAPTVVAVRDRIRSLVLARVDAAAAGFLYYPGRVFHDARGSYAVVGRTAPEAEEALSGTRAGDVEVEPLLADDISSPRRRVRFQRPAPGPLAAVAAASDPEGPEEPAAGPDPVLIGDFPIVVALLPVELVNEHIATYRLGPLLYEVRQRQILAAGQRAEGRSVSLSTWALALFPNPEAPGAGGSAPLLALDAARLIAAAMRAILPSMFRGAAEGLGVTLRIEAERPTPEQPLGPWEGFYLFDMEQGGNGTARALHRDKVEELLRLCRLMIERVLDPGRLLALHDHWGDPEEILANQGGSAPEEGGGARWQSARTSALIWLDSRLRPEGRAEGFEPEAGIFAGGSQPGEGDLIDIGRCWYSRDGRISDLVWAKHRWRLPGHGEAMLDVGFDRETAAAARFFTVEAKTQALYRALYQALAADPELRLPDGTVWGMLPREAWRPDGGTAKSCREGLAHEQLADYSVFAWGMAAHGYAVLESLAGKLREESGAGAEGEEGRLALLTYLARFVQGIPYSIPGALRRGLRPPVSTLLYRLGDCDSKSLLLALLARHCGIPAGLFVSFQDLHAMAAVAAPDPWQPAAESEDAEPEAAGGAPDEGESEAPGSGPADEPESPSLARLTLWSASAGLEEPPHLWGELPVAPKETAVHLYVPIESTAYLPVGFARVTSPATWSFLPLAVLANEFSGGGSHHLSPSDRAEHEDR